MLLIYEDCEETWLRRLVEKVYSPLYRLEARILRYLEVRECEQGGHKLEYDRSYMHEVRGYYGPSIVFEGPEDREETTIRREVDFQRCDCGLKTRHFFKDTGAEVSPQEMMSAVHQSLHDSTRIFDLLPKEPWRVSE